jgi:hypothetical protein|tara:strand:+ start:50 stop:238 length:189 start_codon:yes stop_codon:yes gene_type:complete
LQSRNKAQIKIRPLRRPNNEPKILSKKVFPKEEDGLNKILLIKNIEIDVAINITRYPIVELA